MILSYLSIIAFLVSAFLLARYFIKDEIQHQYQQTITLMISFAIISQALTFTDFWTQQGIIFGLANSASFAAWLIVILLFIASISKPVHSLGIIVYPMAALTIMFGILFPDSGEKLVPLSIASHVFLSISAYALLALSVCQSVLCADHHDQIRSRYSAAAEIIFANIKGDFGDYRHVYVLLGD